MKSCISPQGRVFQRAMTSPAENFLVLLLKPVIFVFNELLKVQFFSFCFSIQILYFIRMSLSIHFQLLRVAGLLGLPKFVFGRGWGGGLLIARRANFRVG